MGHFKFINGAKRIDDTFIICQDHADLDLTSKVDHVLESIEFRIIIAHIKPEVKLVVLGTKIAGSTPGRPGTYDGRE